MTKFITAQQAASLVNDGDVIAFAADGLVSFPHEIVNALEARFLAEGHPAGITSLRAAGMGNWNDGGETHFCHPGMIKRTISSYLSTSPALEKLVESNQIQGYLFPLGPIMQMFREAGRGIPGVLSKIGLGTFMDPRNDGGKLNQLTKEQGEDLVEYIPDLMGEEYLFYKDPGINVALLRGTTADYSGNISCEKEPIDLEMLAVAQAAKADGGIVICQVERIVPVNEIHPRMVKVPGIYIDYVVQAVDVPSIPQNTGRVYSKNYNPGFTGEKYIPIETSSLKLPLDIKKVMARRAAMEIKDGDTVNFGLGMPSSVPTILSEAGVKDRIWMISETGVIGGVPASDKLDFGCHWNPLAFCDHGEHFSFFDGGCLNVGIFGLSEADADGNINTSHLNGKISGVGGFVDIAQNSGKVIFMGTFTAVGIQAEVRDGKINITREGKFKKFIKECKKKTFCAAEYLKTHESILFITERCVIRRTKNAWILSEIAPGIDIKTQITDQCDLDLVIPEGGPKLMDPSLFTEDGFTLKM